MLHKQLNFINKMYLTLERSSRTLSTKELKIKKAHKIIDIKCILKYEKCT
jgi:hypothetical protein